MKKLFAISALALLSFSAAKAQSDDKILFNHLSVGVTTGTPGLIGFDLATTCTPYVQIRAGLAIMPNFKYSTDIEVDAGTYNNDINNMYTQFNTAKAAYTAAGNATAAGQMQDIMNLMVDADGNLWRVADKYGVEGKVGFTNGKILFDIFPFNSNKSSFHLTFGAYFGTSKIISVYNKELGSLGIVNTANRIIDAYNAESNAGKGSVYAELGDYKNLGPDAEGNVDFSIKVSGFKPYLGIGFGRAVPKSRVGFMFELGCMFWKTPSIVFTGNQVIDIDKDKAGNEDVGKAIDIISKFKVYPCLNFRLCGRIF